MGFTRGLLNVFSLGAPYRVDKAKDEYDSTVRQYKKRVDEIHKLHDSIQSLQTEILKKQKYVDSHRSKLNKYYKNPQMIAKLSEHTQNALAAYRNHSLTISKTEVSSKTSLCLDVFDDDAVNNLAGIAATFVMGPLGVLGAHLNASDEIKNIEKQQAEIVNEIRRISPMIATLAETESKLIVKDEAYKTLCDLCQQGVLWKIKKKLQAIIQFFKRKLQKEETE